MTAKEKIRNQIIENEKNELKGLKEMYQIHAEAADIDEESSLSSEDFVTQDQNRDSAKVLEMRIQQLKNELDYFLNLDISPKTKVEPGALVMTDSLNFFVGISASMFQSDGKNYIGIEVNAPIYSALRDAQAGDEVSFNDKKYKILEIL